MVITPQIDIAISATGDCKLASFISERLKKENLHVAWFREPEQQALAAGRLIRDLDRKTFRTATLCVVLWSAEYNENRLCRREWDDIKDRHRYDSRSLFLVSVDGKEPPEYQGDVSVVHLSRLAGDVIDTLSQQLLRRYRAQQRHQVLLRWFSGGIRPWHEVWPLLIFGIALNAILGTFVYRDSDVGFRMDSIGTFVVAVALGPWYGAACGAVSGLMPDLWAMAVQSAALKFGTAGAALNIGEHTPAAVLLNGALGLWWGLISYSQAGYLLRRIRERSWSGPLTQWIGGSVVLYLAVIVAFEEGRFQWFAAGFGVLDKAVTVGAGILFLQIMGPVYRRYLERYHELKRPLIVEWGEALSLSIVCGLAYLFGSTFVVVSAPKYTIALCVLACAPVLALFLDWGRFQRRQREDRILLCHRSGISRSNVPMAAFGVILFVVFLYFVVIRDLAQSSGLLAHPGVSRSLGELIAKLAVFCIAAAAVVWTWTHISRRQHKGPEQGTPALGFVSGGTFFAFALCLNVLLGTTIFHSTGGVVFLDTAGTFVVALVLGPLYAAVCGVLTNLLCQALYPDSAYFHFFAVNALLGVYWGLIAKRYPGHVTRLLCFKGRDVLRALVIFGLGATILSTFSSTIIHWWYLNLRHLMPDQQLATGALAFLFDKEASNLFFETLVALGALNISDKLLTVGVGAAILVSAPLYREYVSSRRQGKSWPIWLAWQEYQRQRLSDEQERAHGWHWWLAVVSLTTVYVVLSKFRSDGLGWETLWRFVPTGIIIAIAAFSCMRAIEDNRRYLSGK